MKLKLIDVKDPQVLIELMQLEKEIEEAWLVNNFKRTKDATVLWLRVCDTQINN